MAAESLEKRVAVLEEEVNRLKYLFGKDELIPWWKRIAGTFANDPIYDEAMRIGRKYRESTGSKPRKTKPRKKKNGHS